MLYSKCNEKTQRVGVRRDRSQVTVSPATENTRSWGTDVAVMHTSVLTWHAAGTNEWSSDASTA